MLLQSNCELLEDSQYSLHHEYTESRIQSDENCIKQLQEHIETTQQNPFNVQPPQSLSNIVTGKKLDNENVLALQQCLEDGEKSYSKYRTERLVEKTQKLLDTIKKPATKKKTRTKEKKIDVKKENNAALKYIEYARMRDYDVANLLKFELTSVPLFLVKDDLLRKSVKSELIKEIEALTENPSPLHVPQNIINCMIVIDFMSYARKVPIKKLGLKTFGDLFSNLWDTFQNIHKNCSRIDIVFDLYVESSLKTYGRIYRYQVDSIEVDIRSISQPLPVEVDTFWSSSTNKTKLPFPTMDAIKLERALVSCRTGYN